MMDDPLDYVNYQNHFDQLRSSIKQVLVTKHFRRDAPDFDTSLVLDSAHEHFTHLHKFEENVSGNHIFRALKDGVHIVYAVDKKHRLIFLRAFKNFKKYESFLEHKKKILRLIGD